jgi:CMP-N,N'-diacetyllegionaminic acid synthase
VKKLILIPARGGSKGLVKKNILPLNEKPLIYYSLDVAKEICGRDDTICVSSDNSEIIKKVQEYGISVPFVRPDNLSNDTTSSRDVVIHALKWYERQNITFDIIILLQPTSPLRKSHHVIEALKEWRDDLDMIVSVKRADSNPYYNLFKEGNSGFLEKVWKSNESRRQDAPVYYEYNGAIYIIRVDSILQKQINEFNKIEKYVMDKISSVDIDDIVDFELANILIKNE